MSARLNPPNKYIKIGNLIAVPTGNMALKRQQSVPRTNNPLISTLSHPTSFVNSSSQSTLDKYSLYLSPQYSSNASSKNIPQVPKFSSTLNSEASTYFSTCFQQITQKLLNQRAQTSALDLKQHNPNNSSTQPLNSSQQHITQKLPDPRAQTSAWDLKQQHPTYTPQLNPLIHLSSRPLQPKPSQRH